MPFHHYNILVIINENNNGLPFVSIYQGILRIFFFFKKNKKKFLCYFE